MIQYAVIDKIGSPAALVLHDASKGRVVYKGPADLREAFAVAYDRPVVVSVHTASALIRKKLDKLNDQYLKGLLDNFVHSPYRVRSLESYNGANSLDVLADKLAKDILESNKDV